MALFSCKFFCITANHHPTVAPTRVSPPHAVWDSPNQAAQYRTLRTELGASTLTRYLDGLRVKVDYCITH
jgi:hypothetical protein